MAKKVLILANSSSGLYDFRGGLIRRLIRAGCEVVCAVPDAESVKELRETGARVVRTKINRRGMNPVEDLKLLRGYRALLKKEVPDQVLTYTIKPNIYGGLACRKEGVPCIATVTGLGSVFEAEEGNDKKNTSARVIRHMVTRMYRAALKDCKCLFFQNEHNRDVFASLGIPCGKTRLVKGSGVDLARHPEEAYPSREDETVQFLYVGRLMKEKGSFELLNAFLMLQEEETGRVHLTCVGYMEDTATREAEELERLAKEAEKAGVLTRLPYDKEIHARYAASDAVLMPSYHEGMSNVAMEASACGRPVLASNIPGCREIVQEGVTGFLFASKDTRALYDALKRFLALPLAERRMMGRAARRKMECEFDREHIIDAYMEELQ